MLQAQGVQPGPRQGSPCLCQPSSSQRPVGEGTSTPGHSTHLSCFSRAQPARQIPSVRSLLPPSSSEIIKKCLCLSKSLGKCPKAAFLHLRGLCAYLLVLTSLYDTHFQAATRQPTQPGYLPVSMTGKSLTICLPYSLEGWLVKPPNTSVGRVLRLDMYLDAFCAQSNVLSTRFGCWLWTGEPELK